MSGGTGGLPSFAFSQAMDSLQTGDIVLLQPNDIGSTATRCALRCFYSHVGLIVRAPRQRVASLYRSDYANHAVSTDALADLHILEAVPRRGLAIFPLEPRLARTVNIHSHVATRRLVGTLSDVQQSQLEAFLVGAVGRPLEAATSVSCAPPLAALLSQCLRPFDMEGMRVDDSDFSAFFCTELLAKALQSCAVLRSEVPIGDNDFPPNAFISTSTPSSSPTGQPLTPTLDSSCEGTRFSFDPEIALLWPGSSCELRGALEQRKRTLLRAALAQYDPVTGVVGGGKSMPAGGRAMARVGVL